MYMALLRHTFDGTRSIVPDKPSYSNIVPYLMYRLDEIKK